MTPRWASLVAVLATRYVFPRHVLVVAWFTGESEDAFANDVAHHFTGAALNRVRAHADEGLSHITARHRRLGRTNLRVVRAVEHPFGAHEIDAQFARALILFGE